MSEGQLFNRAQRRRLKKTAQSIEIDVEMVAGKDRLWAQRLDLAMAELKRAMSPDFSNTERAIAQAKVDALLREKKLL